MAALTLAAVPQANGLGASQEEFEETFSGAAGSPGMGLDLGRDMIVFTSIPGGAVVVFALVVGFILGWVMNSCMCRKRQIARAVRISVAEREEQIKHKVQEALSPEPAPVKTAPRLASTDDLARRLRDQELSAMMIVELEQVLKALDFDTGSSRITKPVLIRIALMLDPSYVRLREIQAATKRKRP